MADYMVGRSGGKDRYMVGWNQSKENANAYKVGNSSAQIAAVSKKLGGDQDPVVGSKSAFDYAADNEATYKDVGDKSDNMNFGGSNSSGAPANPNKAGGEIDLAYTEKGDWDAKKDALARRKAQMEAAKQYASNDQYDSPVVAAGGGKGNGY